MTFQISNSIKDNPMLQIDLFDHRIEFSVVNIPPEKHSWLGHSLEKQIKKMVEIEVQKAIFNQQQQLRQLMGIR